MQQSKSQNISQQFIDSLFRSVYFIDKFQQLQLLTYNDLQQAQLIIENADKKYNAIDISAKQNNQNKQTTSQAKMGQKLNGNSKLPVTKCIKVQDIVQDISQLLLENFKQTVYKQTNSHYENKFNVINIMEEIQNLKQSISKLGQIGSFTTVSKTLPTQESLTPQNEEKQKQKGRAVTQTSMFLENEDQSSIQFGFSRKNLAQDRLNNYSFMNSFLNENKINPRDQQIINQRINASISKVQSSMEDRITQLQKEFTRRIQQVMRTIKNLIQAMNQNQLQHEPRASFEKTNRYKTQVTYQQSIKKQIDAMKKNKQTPKQISSKSTILTPKNKQQYQESKVQKKSQYINLQVVSGKGQQKIASTTKNQQASLLNKSTKTLSSFFNLGRSGGSTK